jgi:phosphoglycerate dehydrogenase-like enzyme
MTKTIAVINAMARAIIEPKCPDWLDIRYFSSTEELNALAPHAEIGWFDLFNPSDMVEAVRRAEKLKWLSSIYAGVERLPLDLLRERGTICTNGAGLLSDTMAEYAVMGMLSLTKGYDKVIAAASRREWLKSPPATGTLVGAKVMIIGYGAIGREIEKRLLAFDAEVTKVRRNPAGPGELGPDEWRAQLGNFDWIVVAAPATPETKGLIGAPEFAAMKQGARIANIARGTLIDTDALIEAMKSGKIAGAYLDVTDPEPLPADHPLWGMENVQISMHMSGPSQAVMFTRAAHRFLDNLERYRKGEPLHPQVDYSLGY